MPQVIADRAKSVTAEGQVIRSVLGKAVAGEWESFSPPGKGKEWRIETDELAAASLVWNDEVVVHLQVFPKNPELSKAKKLFGQRLRGKQIDIE